MRPIFTKFKFHFFPLRLAPGVQFSTSKTVKAVPFVAASTSASTATSISNASKLVASINARIKQKNSKTPADNRWKPGQLRRQLLGWGIFFGGFLTWAVWYGRSIQIKYTPLFKGVMFTLRQDKQVQKWIGVDIKPSTRVDGFINHIKGRADIQFEISGSHGVGKVQLEARRNSQDWFVQRLKVEVAGETIVNFTLE